jgi:hypothetical protein
MMTPRDLTLVGGRYDHSAVTGSRAAQPMRPRALTFPELFDLPVVLDLATAARAIGVSLNTAYRLAGAGQLPCPVMRPRWRYLVPTLPLMKALGMENAPYTLTTSSRGRLRGPRRVRDRRPDGLRAVGPCQVDSPASYQNRAARGPARHRHLPERERPRAWVRGERRRSRAGLLCSDPAGVSVASLTVALAA